MRALLVLSTLALLTAGAVAQEPDLEGDWRDEFGTVLRLSHCGDGTQLCGVLIDIQGESRTEANLAYVNQQVMQADQTGSHEWQGAVIFEGNEAKATITHVAPDTIEITGCRVVILCETLAFHRVGNAAAPPS
jgi:uncharacterized protein (DUF2147 family)